MINPLDEGRVRYVNHIMGVINSQSDEIYEGLIDRDFKQAEISIDELILILSNIKESIIDKN